MTSLGLAGIRPIKFNLFYFLQLSKERYMIYACVMIGINFAWLLEVVDFIFLAGHRGRFDNMHG